MKMIAPRAPLNGNSMDKAGTERIGSKRKEGKRASDPRPEKPYPVVRDCRERGFNTGDIGEGGKGREHLGELQATLPRQGSLWGWGRGKKRANHDNDGNGWREKKKWWASTRGLKGGEKKEREERK